MATKINHRHNPVGANEPIIIERRQIIETITPGSGPESMLATAFLAIGRYLSEHDDRDGIELTFDHYGRTFRGTLEPDTEDDQNPFLDNG